MNRSTKQPKRQTKATKATKAKKVVKKVAKRTMTTTKTAKVASKAAPKQQQSVKLQTQQTATLSTTSQPTTVAKSSHLTFTPQQFALSAFTTPTFTTQQSSFHTMKKQPFKTTLPQSITSKIEAINFIPTKTTQKRTFLGNLFGKKDSQPIGTGAEQSGKMGMMEMMEMMQMMTKMTKLMETGMTPAAKAEILQTFETMRAKHGGNLPAGYDSLMNKIKNDEHIGIEEVMALTGLQANEVEEIRQATLAMKSGQGNQMQFMMKVAEVFSRAQQRQNSTPKVDGKQ